MTNTALTTDPWATTDPTSHPQSPIVHPAAHSTRLSLALARDYAAEALCDSTSTPAEMQYAGYYFADAEAIIAQHANPDTA